MIESKDNNKIKYLRKLQNNKYMMQEKKFIVEGKHLVSEAYKSGVLIETYSLSDINYGVTNYIVSNDVYNSISTLPSKSDVIGLCKFIDENKKLGNKILILDNVQDPGNLGTIIRSSKAFNFDTIVLSNTSVKKYNEKVIRATQGMLFKTNVIVRDLISFIPDLKSSNYTIYGTNVINGINVNSIDKSSKLAVILGNEGTGISNEVSNLVDKNIYIDINSECESLNVAVAASIIMYEINKGE